MTLYSCPNGVTVNRHPCNQMCRLAGEETSDVHRYDLASDKWEEVSEKGLPEAISVALCFALGDRDQIQ